MRETPFLDKWRDALDDDARYHVILRAFLAHFAPGTRASFPHPRFSAEERVKILEAVNRNTSGLGVGRNTGTLLSTSYFRHFFEVTKAGQPSLIALWHDDASVKRAIEDCLRGSIEPTVKEIHGALRRSDVQVTNFRVMAAKYLYERYVPAGGVVLDPSAGWGARQMAARSLGLGYVGLEPYSRTYECGLRLAADLDRVYGGFSELVQVGSEDYCPHERAGKFDFAFTSPPYFDIEPYSTEATQSHVKFPTLPEWYSGFVFGTARNVRRLLKPGASCAINVAKDFRVQFVRCYEQAGFRLVDELAYELTSVPGRGAPGVQRAEPILIFE